MKIDAPNPSNLSDIAPNLVKFKAFVFEKWLASPEGQNKGDEYYWLHQHQLQNSALRFNFGSQESKAKIREVKETQNRTDSPDKNLAEKKQILFLKEKVKAVEPSEPNPSLPSGLSPLFKFISKLITPFIPQQAELNNQSLPCSLSKNEFSVKKVFSHRVIFKNYQLFIEAKEAELSLNGLDLTKQQLNDLNRVLKHWLQNKGIKLQKLIINGVIL